MLALSVSSVSCSLSKSARLTALVCRSLGVAAFKVCKITSYKALPWEKVINTNLCAKGDAVPAAWASEAEICTGFLVVSIPTYRLIYRRIVYGSADALDAGAGKPYQLEPISHESNNHASHNVQVSAQRILSPAKLGISVTDDFELVRHIQHNGSWVRMEESEIHGSRF